MTVGEKIRKYRELRGLKQKELGVKVGFKESTADVRINQYESNRIAPKKEIRTKIADALDVDLSALSDLDIQTNEDIIRIFFFLEEKIGMGIEKTEDKIYLTIDRKDSDLYELNSYLDAWHSRRQSFMRDALKEEVKTRRGDVRRKARDTYENWKAKFPKEISNC